MDTIITDQYSIDNIELLDDVMAKEYLLDSEEGMIVRVDATHTGYINLNNYFYDSTAAKKAASSWVKPRNLPVFRTSDAHQLSNSEPIGIVVDYKFIKLVRKTKKDPDGKIQLTLKVLDYDAIKKIQDGRYNSVSVASRPKKIVCSICGEDITDNPWGHVHQKGEKYDGELAYWIVYVDRYVEVSFVNDPADQSNIHYAGVVGVGQQEEEKDMEKSIEEYFEENYEQALQEVCDELGEDLEDKKLSAKERKNLPSNQFCGPNRSFPVPDKEHVLAALRLLGRYKGPGDKSKIRACILRRAKALGMKIGKDSEEVTNMAKNLEDQVTSLEDQISKLSEANKILEDQVKSKDEEIAKLKDQIAKFEEKEKLELAKKILNRKKELKTKDVSAEDFDEQKFLDEYIKKSVDVLSDLYNELSLIEIEVNVPEPVDIEDAAKDENGNLADENKDENSESKEQDNDEEELFK